MNGTNASISCRKNRVVPTICYIFLTIGYILGFAGCQSNSEYCVTNHELKGPVQDYTIQLTGTTGLAVLGALNVDGTTKQVSTELPAEFQIRASALVCYFQKQTDAGQLELRIRRNQDLLGSSVAKGSLLGVRAEVDNHGTMFTCF